MGDFLAELQSVREERRQKKVEVEGEEKVEEGELSSKALTARLAAKELETLQVLHLISSAIEYTTYLSLSGAA